MSGISRRWLLRTVLTTLFVVSSGRLQRSQSGLTLLQRSQSGLTLLQRSQSGDGSFHFPFTYTKKCQVDPRSKAIKYAHSGMESQGWALQGESEQHYKLELNTPMVFRWESSHKRCGISKDARRDPCTAADKSVIDGAATASRPVEEHKLSKGCADARKACTATTVKILDFGSGQRMISMVALGAGGLELKVDLRASFRFSFGKDKKSVIFRGFIPGVGKKASTHVRESNCRELPQCIVTVSMYEDDATWFHKGVSGYEAAHAQWKSFVQLLETDVFHAQTVPSQFPNAPPMFLGPYSAIEMHRGSLQQSVPQIIFVSGLWYQNKHERRPGNNFQLRVLVGGDEGTAWVDAPKVPFPASWKGCGAGCKVEAFPRDSSKKFCCCDKVDKECPSRAQPGPAKR